MTAVHRMGELISRALADEGITQRRFAEMVDVTERHLRSVLSCRTAGSPQRLDEWAGALGRRWVVALLPIRPSRSYWASQPQQRLYEALMGCLSELLFIEETLAASLGYERSGGPGDPNGGGYVVGDHTAASLALEVKKLLRGAEGGSSKTTPGTKTGPN